MTAFAAIFAAWLAVGGMADDQVLKVDATQVIHRVSPLLYGACIEDVNHEIYGGLYSQMIFGESFQEPPLPVLLKGFTAYGGRWERREGDLFAEGGRGHKLISDQPAFAAGEVGVDVFLEGKTGGNAGLIVKVSEPGLGADKFTGYEITLDTAGHVVLGRHRQNWEPIRIVPRAVPADRWISLVVRMTEKSLEVRIDGQSVATFEDVDHPLVTGQIGLRTWMRPARFRNLWVKTGNSTQNLAFEPAITERAGVSGMWRPFTKGTARGILAIDTSAAFIGRQSQRVTFRDGDGEVGIENEGLNSWGLNVVASRPFEGYLWARAEKPTPLSVALESRDGKTTHAETQIDVRGNEWKRYDFTLTPATDDQIGRFAIKLKERGSVVLGHAFLQPGDWGRFKGLPNRKDVAEALVAQGLTVLRYGGSMVNHPEYRWKTMIGPRDQRPPSAGTWYPFSSNGWGIFDFLNFCEAAGFLGIPAVNMGETPQDMADFVDYANGPADSPWGRKRAADGHPEPYRLKYVQLGNEEAVNENYWRLFQPIAEAMWAKDPALILVVGDFAYGKVIDDPFHFAGGASVDTLAAHKKILELARQRGREVWFDIHIGTEQPPAPHGLNAERSYIEQLGKLAPGAKFKVVIFEFNANNHALKRGLSNALAINEVERVGDRLPIACSANCLQPDGQNDNGWNQGLVFLNPRKVWLQPPGHVTQMARHHFQPLLLKSELQGHSDKLSVNAKRSEDGKTLVLQVVNWGEKPLPLRIQLEGFNPSKPIAVVEELSGPLDAVNTSDAPDRVKPTRSEWRHELKDGMAQYRFKEHAFTIIRFD